MALPKISYGVLERMYMLYLKQLLVINSSINNKVKVVDSVLQIFCILTGIIYLVVLSVIKSGMLQYASMIVDLSVPLFSSVCVMYLDDLLFKCIHIYDCYVFLINWPFSLYEMLFFISCNAPVLRPTSSGINIFYIYIYIYIFFFQCFFILWLSSYLYLLWSSWILLYNQSSKCFSYKLWITMKGLRFLISLQANDLANTISHMLWWAKRKT